MKNRKLLILWVAVLFTVVGLSLVYAQDKTEEINVDTNVYERPPQGTIISCELCVILYPEHYKKDPEKCPVCHGTGEHFEPAQMMTREMAQMRLHEIDLDIQEFLHETVLDSLDKPVDVEQLKKLRKFYKRKLIHILVHDFIEVEPVKEKICWLDEIIESRGSE